MKVKKIFLRRGYTPVNKTVFKRGTTLAFDCFIQRFNGFVIWIEAGTLLDDKLFHRIQNTTAQLFIHNRSFEEYQAYTKQYPTASPVELESPNLEEAIQAVEHLASSLEAHQNITQKLEHVYITAKNLFAAWLDQSEPPSLPVLLNLAEHLVFLLNQENVTLSKFNTFLDDDYTLPAHLTKVAFFAALIGVNADMDMTDQQKLVLAALLHDVGKTSVDESLLDKPEKLTPEEFKIIQGHATESVILAKQYGVRDRAILDGIGEHHERLDGTGYPKQLSKDDISQFGKILAVCDVFDALITTKPYRGAYTTFNALQIIKTEYKKKLSLTYVTILIQHLK